MAAADLPLKKTPEIIERIHELMVYETAGDPMTGSKWTRKTTESVAMELRKLDIVVSPKTVSALLRELGYSMRVNHKKMAASGIGTKHERNERDMQFKHIATMRKRFSLRKEPIISVDTKKKELIGNFKNNGVAWRNSAALVNDHDFPSMADGKAIPYGIYDVTANRGSVIVGTSHDTPAFAASSICLWWEKEGRQAYPHAKRLLILADNGGSNRPQCGEWLRGISQQLCNRHGLSVSVCHYPPGASKWNPIEHRLFSEISKNWAGVPLRSYETVLRYIRTTATKTGLSVKSYLCNKFFPVKQKTPKEILASMKLKKDRLLPKWNYTIMSQN
jgi:hypothetical protein